MSAHDGQLFERVIIFYKSRDWHLSRFVPPHFTGISRLWRLC